MVINIEASATKHILIKMEFGIPLFIQKEGYANSEAFTLNN